MSAPSAAGSAGWHHDRRAAGRACRREVGAPAARRPFGAQHLAGGGEEAIVGSATRPRRRRHPHRDAPAIVAPELIGLDLRGERATTPAARRRRGEPAARRRAQLPAECGRLPTTPRPATGRLGADAARPSPCRLRAPTAAARLSAAIPALDSTRAPRMQHHHRAGAARRRGARGLKIAQHDDARRGALAAEPRARRPRRRRDRAAEARGARLSTDALQLVARAALRRSRRPSPARARHPAWRGSRIRPRPLSCRGSACRPRWRRSRANCRDDTIGASGAWVPAPRRQRRAGRGENQRHDQQGSCAAGAGASAEG